MENKKLVDLLNKIEDNKKVANILEEIIEFINDVKPALDAVNREIKENINQIPSATQKITKVTEATELATTEMLNILDNVFPKIDNIREEFTNITELSESSNSIFKNILLKIKTAIEKKEDLTSILPKITETIDKIEAVDFDNSKNIVNKDIAGISDDATSIMMALQVQDITSQQLAAVKHLIDKMQAKLSSLIDKVDKSEFKDLLDDDIEKSNVTDLHRKIAFDPDAVDTIDENVNRQKMADEYFKSSKEENEETAKVDDSDNDNEIKTDTDNNDSLSNDEKFDKEKFKDVDDNGPVSQDDIDKMFG